jgi:hypothetical protein
MYKFAPVRLTLGHAAARALEVYRRAASAYVAMPYSAPVRELFAAEMATQRAAIDLAHWVLTEADGLALDRKPAL